MYDMSMRTTNHVRECHVPMTGAVVEVIRGIDVLVGKNVIVRNDIPIRRIGGTVHVNATAVTQTSHHAFDLVERHRVVSCDVKM